MFLQCKIFFKCSKYHNNNLESILKLVHSFIGPILSGISAGSSLELSWRNTLTHLKLPICQTERPECHQIYKLQISRTIQIVCFSGSFPERICWKYKPLSTVPGQCVQGYAPEDKPRINPDMPHFNIKKKIMCIEITQCYEL